MSEFEATLAVSQAIPSDPVALRRLVRDLVSFSALPAVWIQYDAQRIVDSVAEVLANALGLDFVFIAVRSGALPHEALGLPRRLDSQRQTIRAVVSSLLQTSTSNTTLSIPNPVGEGQTRIAIQLVGYPAESGQLLAGSSRADFPTDTDRLLLNMGANQAAIVLTHKRSEQAARESEERFRALSAAAPVGIFTTDLTGRCTYINPRGLALCGLTFAQALSQEWVEWVYAEDRADLRERWLARQGPEFRAEFRMLSPTLGLRWVETRIVPSVPENSPSLGYLGTLTDITAQVDVEADLERRVGERTAELQQANAQLVAEIDGRARAVESHVESEERFQLLVESVVDYAIFLLNPGGYVMSWNAGAERLKQYRAEEIIGRHFSRFYTPADIALGKPDQLLATAEQAGHVIDEGWRVRKDGSQFWASVIITALRDREGQLRGFAKVTRDMTERRQAEEYLEQTNVRLRQLSAHLQMAREEERATIARELHDELGQILTVAKMDLSRLVKRLTSGTLSRPLPTTSIVADVRAVIQSIDGSIQSTRRIMQQLRPQTLDDLGLIAALEVQVQQFEERTQIPCRFEADAESITLAPERAIALYRIVQEALTNVARHSGASEVQIRLRLQEQELQLEIRDNGRGISAPEMEKVGHFGVLGIKERATLLGGDVSIRGTPGQGTVVAVRMPVA